MNDRKSILDAISDWLKLLALVVLVAEVAILTAMKLTPEEHPLHAWYPLFMLLFLAVIVVGLFLDHRSHSDTSNNEHVLRLYFDEDVDLAQMQSTVAKCNSSRRGDLDDESSFTARIHTDAGGALMSVVLPKGHDSIALEVSDRGATYLGSVYLPSPLVPMKKQEY